jgi:hypothetical protein
MRDALPREKVGHAVALMSATLGIGMGMGPPLSGVLSGRFGFTSIFVTNASGGLVLTLAVLLLVPESVVRTPARFDYLGALLLSTGLATGLLAVSVAGDRGWTSGDVLGLPVVSGLTLALWFRHGLRVSDPLVDLRTAARRTVLLTNLASAFVAFGVYVNLLATAQHLQMPAATGYGFDMTVTGAGLVMMPSP